jgi:cytochrome c oxidase cbb3-type subunit III
MAFRALNSAMLRLRHENLVGAAILLIALMGCKREDREYRNPPASSEDKGAIVMSTNSPGGGQPMIATSPAAHDHSRNAFDISEGKRLFKWFNCNGCHFNGGGGIGPALMDDQWIYGSSMGNIAATIREGRPNGMPSFRGRIPLDQIWQIAAFVRSLSGLAPKSAIPARSDHLNAVPASQQPEEGVAGGGSPK